jgi:bifunctional UDP-N-acetylglucosamine pyrophosphorylase / glucosamine-1-phosphate N-acetyltransferase
VSRSRPAAVIVLAAGQGTRMLSARPKVLHEIAGRSLLGHALAAARGLEPDHLVVVVRHDRDAVVEHLALIAPDAVVADQDEVPGTGRAAWCGLAALPRLDGTVVVTYGDVPLLTTSTLTDLVDLHELSGDAVTVLTARLTEPTGYGRVLRDRDGAVAAIVEQKDATDEQAALTEVNTGIYAFDAGFLTKALEDLSTDNGAGEAYLTDVVAAARAAGLGVRALPVGDVRETEGVNDRVQLAALGRVLRDRLVEAWMRAGVSVVDPRTTWLDADVELEPDVTLLPGTQLLGATRVARGATVGPDTTLRDCTVGPQATVTRTDATGARIGARAAVGPFSFLRPGTVLGDEGKIGAFVETKNAVVGARSKVPHLSYVGDAEIGEGTNIGAATVFVNYDGVAKHHIRVGDHVRIGSDTMLVAPVQVGDGAYTAAGSVITEDVPPGSMAVGRARQRTIAGWVERKRAGTASAKAAMAATGTAGPDPSTDQPPDQDSAVSGGTGTTSSSQPAPSDPTAGTDRDEGQGQ